MHGMTIEVRARALSMAAGAMVVGGAWWVAACQPQTAREAVGGGDLSGEDAPHWLHYGVAAQGNVYVLPDDVHGVVCYVVAASDAIACVDKPSVLAPPCGTLQAMSGGRCRRVRDAGDQ